MADNGFVAWRTGQGVMRLSRDGGAYKNWSFVVCIDEDDVLGPGKRFADCIAQKTSRKTEHDWYEKVLGHLRLTGYRSPQASYRLGYPSDMLDYRSLTYSRIL